MIDCPDELKRRYSERRLIPFIGAGVSMAVEWEGADGGVRTGPSWSELVNRAAEILGFEEPELLRVRGTNLQILEYFRLQEGGTAKLTNWLARELNPPDEALRSSPIHRELANMTQCEIFYTTNFEHFLEQSFRLHRRSCQVVATEAHMGGTQKETQIVKFHGDLNHPDKMVLSESDYEERLSLSTPLDLRLQADALGKAILFLGYSFRDYNVSYIFRLINESFGRLPDAMDGRRAYIVVPDPSDFERKLFSARNIEVIAIRGSHMTEDVATLLSQLTN